MDAFEGNDKYSPPIRPCTRLQKLKPLTEQQALNVINRMHYTTCEMDPCNTKFLMKFKDTLIGIITKIINISLTSGQYLDEWKFGPRVQELLPYKQPVIYDQIN